MSCCWGSEFENRFKTIFKQISNNKTTKEVLQILYIFDVLEVPYLPIDLLLEYLKNDKSFKLDDFDSLIRKKGKRGVSLRNSFFNNLIQKTLNGKTALQHIEHIIKYIAPFVDEKEESIYKEIYVMLIRPKGVNKTLNVDILDFIKMLERVRTFYDWSYNYWLHLGISEQMRNDYELALNHLKQAEAISPKSYMVHNAIGRNFLKKAYSMDNLTAAQPYIEEGDKILSELIHSRDTTGARGYSIHSLISEYIKIFTKFNSKIPTKKFNTFKSLASDLEKRHTNDPMVKHLSKIMERYEKKFITKKYDWSELDLIKEIITEEEMDEILDF